MKQKLAQVGLTVLGALATGTLLLLALPLGEQSYFAWVMLIPLLLTTRERGFLYGFLGGLGAVFWCAWLATTGIFYPFKHADVPPAWTYTACGIFAASFSLFFGIYSDKDNHMRPMVWLACLAVVLEAALLFQIPAHLALTQYRNWTMMFVAGVGGIWLVSFLIWLANIYVSQDFKKRYWIGLAVAAASFLVTRFDPFTKLGGETFPVGVAQVTDGMDDELVAAHRQASKEHPVFVVWPEFSGILFVRRGDTQKLKDVSTESAPLVTSFRDEFEPLPHNVAALFAYGQEYGRYEKRKLFGAETKMHTPGTKSFAAALPRQTGKVALNICYDSCFPAIIRESANQPEVHVIALPTIDPDSKHYFMAAMHTAYTSFRAAENGIAIVRADGNFGSMIVNERGAIVAELKNQQGSKVGLITGRRVWTLAGAVGDWFLAVCLVVVFYPSLRWLVQRVKTRRHK